MLQSLHRFSGSAAAKERLKIIRFYERYGEKAAKEAFGADRKVISRWRKLLRESSGKLSALVPCSTRPQRMRKSAIAPAVVEFIRQQRQAHPRLGKEKLKVFLDKYCAQKRLKSISASSIGLIIKKHNLFFQPAGRVYHDPDGYPARKGRTKRNRARYAPRKPELGHIVSDTVQRITDGVKDYFYSAVDANSRFGLTLNYKALNSRNMKDFYGKFKSVYPGRIALWQNDNGAEHLGEFEQALKADGLKQLFSYPRCPRINGHIERYNRTLQEEFIDNNETIIHDKVLFNKALAEFVLFYNCERPHHSLGLKTPLEYLAEILPMSHMSVTYTFC